jgi:poly(A) polymerase
MTNLAHAAWFNDPALKRVFALLNADGGEGRVVGGAVRNSLMGLDVSDIDVATTLTPDVVIERAKAVGIKAVPTGVEHGTVTLVIDRKPFEVTTLRADVETDGRRAKVAFSTDWQTDAERRDLTINALYVDEQGEVVDLVGGLADLEKRNIRFIGDAATRISEDYLRVLRFFRFFAYYGSGRPDADGLRACAAARSKLQTLSAERVWSEMRKLLSAERSGAGAVVDADGGNADRDPAGNGEVGDRRDPGACRHRAGARLETRSTAEAGIDRATGCGAVGDNGGTAEIRQCRGGVL